MTKKNLPKVNAVIKMRLNNPELTLREIGEAFNLTRERIRQILVAENIETRSSRRVAMATTPYPVCLEPECENRVPHRGRSYCVVCVKSGVWQRDNGLRRRRIPQVTSKCTRCNTDITMRETLYNRQRSKYKNMYCSQKCRSMYVWETQIVKNVGGRIVKVPLGKEGE